MHLHQALVYLDSIADYKKNTYTLTEEVRAKASQCWRLLFRALWIAPSAPLRPGCLSSFRLKDLPVQVHSNLPPQFSRNLKKTPLLYSLKTLTYSSW